MVKIVVGIPCFGTLNHETFTALVETYKHQDIVGHVVVGGTLLPMARNQVVRKVYEQYPDFTHIMFIDADMADFQQDHVAHLLQHDKPIISGVCTARVPPYMVCSEFYSEGDRREFVKRIKNNITTPIAVAGTGMAFALIKREVFDALEECVPGSNNIWFDLDRLPRKEILRELNGLKEGNAIAIDEAFKLGLNSRIGTPFVGEDISFCYRAGHHEFRTYIAPMCAVSHLGEFRSNIKVHMNELSEMMKDESCQEPINPHTLLL